MCGIAGFVDFKSQSTAEILTQMSCALAHRGPDGEGNYYNRTNSAIIGLGHRRLSIIDLSSAANQPMHYEGLHLIFNGEIYNYQEIRQKLTGLGHVFTTHSDSEVILHSWKEWGEKCIDQWKGMFAISMYDEHSNELICIRDRGGVKPFFYYWKEGLFLFSSELKAMLAHPGFETEINPEAVASFLQYGYVSSPNCIYSDAHKLPPGHMLRLNLETRVP